MDDTQTPQDPLLGESAPSEGGGSASAQGPRLRQGSGGQGPDQMEKLKALLRKKEVMVPAGLLILLLIGLAAFRGQAPRTEGEPTIDDPHTAIGSTVSGASSFTLDLTKDYIWVLGDGSNFSGSIQTTGTMQRNMESYDVTTQASVDHNDSTGGLTQTESTVRTSRDSSDAAVRFESFNRQYATHTVSLIDAEQASGVVASGSWFAADAAALAEALAPLELHAGAVPLGDDDLLLFENEVVTLMRDLADASELTSDVTEETGDRVRRYRIPADVLNGDMQVRIMQMLRTETPSVADEESLPDASTLFGAGQLSMWQDTASGLVHRIGFTTSSVMQGLQVSVDYVLTDIGSAPAVAVPESGMSADDLRHFAESAASLGEATVLQQQETALRNLWYGLRAYPGLSGSPIPSTENATVNVADSICDPLIDQALLSTCPQDPKTPPGFYGYQSDGVGFVVTALLEESSCNAQISTPPECSPDPETGAGVSEECQALLAASSITRNEAGQCIYEIRG